MHLLWGDALDAFELLDIRADLKHRAGLDVAGQLRVGDLVVVRPPDRWTLRRWDAQQEVGVAEPAAVEERRLEDDVGAFAHRGDGVLGLAPDLIAPLRFVVAGDLDDMAAFVTELGEGARLVLEPPAADDVELWIAPLRAVDEPGQRRALERGEVLAGQVADEIGRGEDGLAVDQLHRFRWSPSCVSLPCARDSSPVASAYG